MDPSFPEQEHPTSDVRGKRGRKSLTPDPDDGPVGRFAHELATLKRAAGDPSYDRMRSEFGAAASKSALSAAARGQALPSWDTTWEFVRSLAVVKLGEDEAVTKHEWQARWENAATTGLDDAPAEPGNDPPSEPEPNVGPPSRKTTRNRAGYSAILVAILGALIVGLVLVERSSDRAAGTESGTGAENAIDADPYPIPGDNSAFAGDVTIPDGTTVEVGQEFVKTWRLHNSGTVAWDTRFLHAFGDTSHVCSSPDRVPVPNAEPGDIVDVSVPVTAKRPGFCHVEWKMVDASGRMVFSNQKKAVYYEVVVD